MYINWISVVITLISTIVFVYVLDSLIFSVLSLTILMGIRCGMGEIILARMIKLDMRKDIISEWLLIIVFICTGWFLDSIWITIIYAIAYGVYLLWKKKVCKTIAENYKIIKKRI